MIHHPVNSQPIPQQFAQQYVAADPNRPRTDSYTVFRTAQGEYFKVFYNEDAMNYNNYELFSNNTFVANQMMHQHHHQQQPQQQHLPNPELYYQQPNANNISTRPFNEHFVNDANNINFINQLVDNWTPNASGLNSFGEYKPFGESKFKSPLPPQNISSTAQMMHAPHNR